MGKALQWILFTFNIKLLFVNIQIIGAYANWLFKNEFASNFT